MKGDNKMDVKEGSRFKGQAQTCSVAKEVNPWYDMVNVPPVNQNCKSLTGECKMEQEEPLVKGGCGHTAEEVEFSAMVCGICFGLMVLLFIGIGIARLFA